MGKAKRIKQRRRSLPERRMVVVNDCEIGQDSGMLTFRVGDEGRGAGLYRDSSGDGDRSGGELAQIASVDAEELYWEAIPLIMRGITPGHPAAAAAGWSRGC